MIVRIFAAILLLLGVSSVQAQDSWTAWIYNDGQLHLVNPFGETSATIAIELNPAFNSISQQVAVSSSGRYVAYIAWDNLLEAPNRQLFIYDVAVRSDVAGYPLPQSALTLNFEFYPTATMFDEAHNRAAFSYFMDDPNTHEIGWEIVVIDYQIDTVIEKLSYQNTPAQIVDNDYIVPAIYAFDGQHIRFGGMTYEASNMATYPAYEWDYQADTVTRIEDSFHQHGDTFPATGEHAYAMNDAQFETPNANITNVVKVDGITVYHTPDHHIFSVDFIQNGERLLIGERSLDNINFWHVLDRDGSIVSTLQGAFLSPRIDATKDGFVALDGNTLFYVETRIGEFTARNVWNNASMGIPSLVLVQANALPSESYAPWTPLESS